MRARQMEYSQPLPIVKDPNEVDESALITRDVSHAHKTLDKDNEEVTSKSFFFFFILFYFF